MAKFFRFRIPLMLILIMSASYIFVSCEKENVPDDDPNVNVDPLASVKSYTYAIMNDIYYWYKDIPKSINAKPIPTIQAYFDTLLVPQDRWSWMMTGQEYLNSEAGVSESYGISLSQPIDYYNDYSVRVRYVHPNTPMAENNVKRGYELTHINGTPVNTLISNGTFNAVFAQKSNQFTFKKHDGQSYTFTASARVITTRSYLNRMVFTGEDYEGLPHSVGYFNYLSFKATMLNDIDEAMAMFKAANIKELILDLRYNGGGDSRATSLLANYIAPVSAENKILAKREHNDKYRSWDNDVETQTIIKRISGSLNLDRVYILTTKGSASASEVLLNGLDPLMSVVHIGSTTYGKPNGMYVLPYPEGNYTSPQYVFLPICFFSVNSVGYGHYLDGIIPDHYRPDDLYHDFGLNDDWIKAALQYVKTGTFPPLPAKPQTAFPFAEGMKLKVEEERADWGVYTAKAPVK